MALQGTLKDFNITEIIQLIGQQLKTGILKIRKEKKIVEINFVDGMIVHVYSNDRGEKDLIGEIFVKAQLITEEQLDRVLGIQRETHQYLGEILVELQYLTKDDVLKVIATQIYETIYDLFWWEDGHFHFDLKGVESYKKIPFALSTEQVLLNILRMVDEWSKIEKKIGSPHMVFKKAEPPTVDSSPPPDLKKQLTPEQELIYNLVDGSLPVEEMIDRSLLGKFIASEIIVNLLEMGLIEKVGILPPEFVEKTGLIQFRGALPFVWYGAFLGLFFLLILYFKPNVLHHFWDLKIERADINVPTHFIHGIQLDRIKNALEVYYMEKGEYPSHLEALISAQLLQRSDLFYRKGVTHHYELKDGKYFLKY